jgi:hypothetical protein
MGSRIAALPTRPAHNTVQLTSLLEPDESYDCTLSKSPMPFPLWWRDIQPYPLSNRRRTKFNKAVSRGLDTLTDALCVCCSDLAPNAVCIRKLLRRSGVVTRLFPASPRTYSWLAASLLRFFPYLTVGLPPRKLFLKELD